MASKGLRLRLRDTFPEGITGLGARLYAAGPGRVLRRTQDKLAAMVDEALSEDATKVLDIGCGPGWLAIGIAKRRPDVQVVAIDLSEEMVDIARRNTRDYPNILCRAENASHLQDDPESVDMVISAESMHHWREPVEAFDNFYRVLKPGGRVWIFDGSDDYDEAELARWLELPIRSRAVLWLPKLILQTHGFSRAEWDTRVPELARRSVFEGGDIDRFGTMRRLELRKEPD